MTVARRRNSNGKQVAVASKAGKGLLMVLGGTAAAVTAIGAVKVTSDFARAHPLAFWLGVSVFVGALAGVIAWLAVQWARGKKASRPAQAVGKPRQLTPR